MSVAMTPGTWHVYGWLLETQVQVDRRTMSNVVDGCNNLGKVAFCIGMFGRGGRRRTGTEAGRVGVP